jgi:hypothetical protein
MDHRGTGPLWPGQFQHLATPLDGRTNARHPIHCGPNFQRWTGHRNGNAVASAVWQTVGVRVSGYFLQRMKTQRDSCNHRTGSIRLNTELTKKPKDLLEYVVVHEMLHLIEPTHSEPFLQLY